MFLEPLEVNNIFVEYLNQTHRLLGNHVRHPLSREMKRTLINRTNFLFAICGLGWRRWLLELLVGFHEMINNMIKQRQMLTERRQLLGI